MSRAVSDLVRAMPMPATMSGQRRRSGKAVLLELADRCDPAGCNAFPSLTTIGLRCELSKRAVEYVLEHLKREALIKVQAPAKHLRGDEYRPTTYQLNLERIQQLAPADAWEKFEAARHAKSDGQGRKFEAQGRKFEGLGSQTVATDPDLDPVVNREGTGRAPTRPFRPTPKKAVLRQEWDDQLEALKQGGPR